MNELRKESTPIAYTPERLAAALWDVRELRDPSGERTGVTDCDQARRPIFWEEAVAENLWPGSRQDAIEEARLTIELANQLPDEPAPALEVTDDQ